MQIKSIAGFIRHLVAKVKSKYAAVDNNKRS